MVLCTESINGSLTVTSYSGLLAGENQKNVIEQCAYDVDVGQALQFTFLYCKYCNINEYILMNKTVFYFRFW